MRNAVNSPQEATAVDRCELEGSGLATVDLSGQVAHQGSVYLQCCV